MNVEDFADIGGEVVKLEIHRLEPSKYGDIVGI